MLVAVDLTIAGDIIAADSLVSEFRYDVGTTVEASTGDRLVVFVERATDRTGLGTFVWNTSSLISPPGRPARWRRPWMCM